MKEQNEIKGWTFEMVEERLIEAVDLWRRTPGGGQWPFAGDGPWHLVKADERIGDQHVRSHLPLSVEEVGERDRVTGWVVAHVADGQDRKLVWRVIGLKADGRTVSWRRLAKGEGVRLGADALRKRYTRAVTAICRALGGAIERPASAGGIVAPAPRGRRRRTEYVIAYSGED